MGEGRQKGGRCRCGGAPACNVTPLVLCEEEMSYNNKDVYIRKCKQVNVLPMNKIFVLNDITLFHKIVYNLIPVKLPDYLALFNGLSRLRSCHLDRLSYVSSVLPRGKNCKILKKSLLQRWQARPGKKTPPGGGGRSPPTP